MTLDLDNLRNLDAAATPGPWSYEHDGSDTAMCCPWIAGPFDGYMGGAQTVVEWNTCGEQSHADAALIAAMRNALPALLHVAQAAEAFEDAQERLEASNLTWGVSDETKAALHTDRKAKRDALLAAVRALKESK